MKQCGSCKELKSFEEFNRKGSGYQSRCRPCQKEWYQNYYNTNSQEKARLSQQRKDNYAWFSNLLREAKDRPCMDCGVKYPPYVMDFDHRDPSIKEYNVGLMVGRGKQAVLDEIAKCDVVCSNCHRERTHVMRGGQIGKVASL